MVAGAFITIGWVVQPEDHFQKACVEDARTEPDYVDMCDFWEKCMSCTNLNPRDKFRCLSHNWSLKLSDMSDADSSDREKWIEREAVCWVLTQRVLEKPNVH